MNIVLTKEFTGYVCPNCGFSHSRKQIETGKTNPPKTQSSQEFIRLKSHKFNPDVISSFSCIHERNGISKNKYVEATLSYVKPMEKSVFMESRSNSKILSYIDNILFKESPMPVYSLYFKLLFSLHLREDEDISDKFMTLLKSNYSTITKSFGNIDIIWSAYMSPSSYKRFRTNLINERLEPIQYLAIEEIHNAMRYSFDENSSNITIERACLLLGYDEIDNETWTNLEGMYVDLLLEMLIEILDT